MKYIIYSITPNNKDLKYAYIGHTINFKSRKNQHKLVCNNETDKHYNFQVYTIIREHNGFDCWDMKPIEEYECDTKTQARIRERYWYDKYMTDGYTMCNDRKPFITETEYNSLYAKDSEWGKNNLDRARQRNINIKTELIQLRSENATLKALLLEHNISF